MTESTDGITLLVVESSPTHLAAIRHSLQDSAPEARLVAAVNLAEARAWLTAQQPDLALVALSLADGSGLELLPATPEETSFPMVVMTRGGNKKEVVEAIKRGALDYVVTTPESFAELPQLIERVRREWTRLCNERRAKQALRESEALLRVIFDQASQLMGVMSPDGTLLKANRTAFDFIGGQDEAVLGKSFWDTPWWRHSPEQQELLRDAIRAAAQGTFVRFEATHPAPDGTLRHIDFSLTPVRDDQGRVVLLVPEGRDITARKQLDEKLRESEEKYRLLFDRMLNGFALHDVICDAAGKPVDYRFLEINDAYQRLTGLKREELIGRTVREALPMVEDVWIERFGTVALTGVPDHFENYSQDLQRWYEVSAYAPRPGQFAVSFADITQRKEVEEALRESEERFRMIFATAAAGMVVISPTGRILRANPAFCAFIGYGEDELVNRFVEELTHPDDREQTARGYGEMLAGQRPSLHYEKRYLRKDGQVVWGHASVACVLAPAHHQSYCVGLVQDITERRRIEEELRMANRELDAFVYTVAHDLRTPLTPIIGYAEYLSESCQDRLDVKSRQLLRSIQQQGLRMLTAMEDLLTLAKLGYLECPAEPVDIDEVLREVSEALSPLLAATGLRVEAGALPAARLPRTLLQLIFQNLVGNAVRYAGRDGGPVEVAGERHDTVVRFSVRDHGPGIPVEEREQIFEPFSRGSTGETSEGTGLGLATVQKIARLYGGKTWVEETPGGGSTFWVEIRDLPPAGA